MTLKSAQLNLWRESIQASFSSYVSFMLDIFLLIILNQYLPIEAVGSYFLILSITYILNDFYKGICTGIKKRVSEETKDNRSQYFWAGISILIALLSILFIILYIIYLFILPVIPYEITYFDIITIYVVFMGLGIKSLVINYISASGFPGKSEIVKVIVSRIGNVILVYSVFNIYTASYQLALLCYGISNFFAFIIIFISIPQIQKPTIDTYKKIYDFSKWSVPNHLLNDLYHRYDTFLLSIMVGLASVGYYDSSVRVAAVGFGIAYGISRTSMVIYSGRDTEGFPIKELFDKSISASSFIIIPALIFFILYGSEFMTILFGNEYENAYWFLIFICIQMIMQNYRLQFESLFGGINKPKITTVASFYTILINIIIAPLFVFLIGGIGVVISSIISEVLRIFIFQKYIYKRFGEYSLPKTAFIQYPLSGIVGLISYFISMQFTSVVVEMIVFVIIFLTVYNIILYLFSTNYRLIITEIFNNEKYSIKN